MNEDEQQQGLTEAEVTSDTRFGPRPPHKDHVHINSPYESRRIPPSGDVSPDGTRSWPQPSNSSRMLVWGGVAVAAAALTAGAVLAGKYVGTLMSEGGDKPRPPAPRHEDMLAEARQTRRDYQRDLEEAAARGRAEGEAAIRREAARRRAELKSGEARVRSDTRRATRRAKGLVEDIEDNTQRLHNSVGSVFNSLGAAVTGFRSVAGQAGSIMREFNDTAQMIRGFLDKTVTQAKDSAKEAGEKVADEVKRRTHNL